MIVSKLHRRRGGWRLAGYLFEFLIVILGVFLGLQAQQWAEARDERARELHLLGRVDADFRGLAKEAKRCMDLYESSLEAIERVQAAVSGAAAGDESTPAGGLERSLIGMTAGTMPPGRSSAYLEMISAGELGLIREEGLRGALIRYDQVAIENRDMWRSLRDSLTPVMPLWLRHVDFRHDIRSGETVIAAYSLEGLASGPDTIAALRSMLGVAANSYQLCERQLRRAEAVADHLGGGRAGP